MKMTNQRGFAHLATLVISVLILAAIASIGYGVYRRSQEPTKGDVQTTAKANDDYTEGVITIKQVSKIGEANKQAMLTKVIRPFVDYQANELKLPVTDVVVTIAKNPSSGQSEVMDGYDLSYRQQNSSAAMGFTFGAEGNIDYWIPQLCDDDGCKPYPAAFKTKYPQNYQAYLRAQTSDKNTLVIREWDVEIPLSEGIDDAYYLASTDMTAGSGSYVRLSTQSLKRSDVNCGADKTGVGSISRESVAVHDKNVATPDGLAMDVNTIRVGDYYYGYMPAQAACSDTIYTATSKRQQYDSKLFEAAVRAIRAVPSTP